ncbi:MAG: hypothetical protein GF398_15865 [Chitinivibrionales bacterium]|nr:hypothetical protein [Chitinivibrionales bacterium]
MNKKKHTTKPAVRRLQVEFSEASMQNIEEMMRDNAINTKKELLNLSLSLLDWAFKEKKSGNSIASVDRKTKTLKEVVLPAFH